MRYWGSLLVDTDDSALTKAIDNRRRNSASNSIETYILRNLRTIKGKGEAFSTVTCPTYLAEMVVCRPSSIKGS